jgi:nucleoid-associated protein YgaU
MRFTMFLSDGTACRAVATVSIKEWETAKDQTTTKKRNSPDHSKRRTVKTGETLALIAHEEYDDAAEWRRIADANGIVDPKDVKPGTILTLPPIL